MQLSLDFEPGLTTRYRTLEDCVAATVHAYRGGVEAVAGALDQAPSELSRRLNAHLPAKEGDGNNRPLRCSDFVGTLDETKDYRPIFWLVEKFLRDPATGRHGTDADAVDRAGGAFSIGQGEAMSPADARLERLIADTTSALNETKDPRFVQAQRFLIGLRSTAQIERMEAVRGLSQQGAPRRIEWMETQRR